MDIEELNTTQIILLALLVSFVTSIATGIVTVSLLAQAPPAVTNTVNQVVERTIETIVPKDVSKPGTTVKETTVVVKEDDLITDTIQKSLGKTGRVYAGTGTTTAIVGFAQQLTQGALITDASIVEKDHLVSFGGTSAVFSVSQKFPSLGIAILLPKVASSTVSAAFRLGDTGALKLGQTVIALISVTSERVSIGAVSSRSDFAEVTRKGADPVTVRTIDTNVSTSLTPGTPLVNIFGDLVGISTTASQSASVGSFLSVSDIAQLLVSVEPPAPQKAP
jgi:hypothetical protein